MAAENSFFAITEINYILHLQSDFLLYLWLQILMIPNFWMVVYV